MGCPLCKDRPPPTTGHPALDFFVRKSSGSLRSSRTRVENATAAAALAAAGSTSTYHTTPTPGVGGGGGPAIQTGLRNCKLEFQQPLGSTAEPPIYFLSGTPAIVHGVPPKKAPRTSGWKDAKLSAPVEEDEEYEAPCRPPRRRHHKKVAASRSTSNTLRPPEPGLVRSASAASLPPDLALPPDMVLPEETAKRLEAYLKKNQSFSSLHLLMSELQAQSQSYAPSLGSSSGDEHWSPKCLDLGEEIITKSKKQAPKASPPSVPIRKRRSIENKDAPPTKPPPPPPPLESSNEDAESDASSEHESLVLRGHWEDQNDTLSIVHTHHNSDVDKKILQRQFTPPNKSPVSPNRLTPSRLTSVDEYGSSRPGTPGPWFDRGINGFPASPQLKRFSPTKNLLVVNRSSNNLHAEIQQQVTPPPSENDEDEDDDEIESTPKEITHSILLKVLQQFSDDFGNNKLFTRRASVAISNISLDGLHEFINKLQQPDENEETASNTPSIGELQSALADLLESEKSIEKEIKKEQKINQC